MNKIILFTIASAIVLSCASQKNLNKTEPYKDTVILIGKATEKGLKSSPFNTWYIPNYSKYKVDPVEVEQLKPLLENITIKAILGTWCGDSKREVPAFQKILKATGFKNKDIEYIAVNRGKKTPQDLEKGLGITNVPTFIFYKNGKEINRIVESPIISLEMDMIEILSDTTYKHKYYK